MKTTLAILAVVVIGLLVGVGSYFKYNGQAVDLEEGIDAQVLQNQNKYSEFSQSAVESMGVATQYQKAMKDVISGAIEGRYGTQGTKPLALAVKEAYPTIDPTLFNKVQVIIESGRKDFSAEQKLLISKVQVYRVALRKPWSGMWMSFAGYPQIDLKDPKYSPIISGQTRENFSTGTDSGIKFN